MAEFPFHLPALRIDRSQRSDIGLRLVGRKVRTTVVSMTRFVRLRSSAENVTLVACADIEKPGLHIETGRHPVRCTQRARAHGMAFQRRRTLLGCDWTPFAVLAVAPGRFPVGTRRHQLSCLAVQDIKE